MTAIPQTLALVTLAQAYRGDIVRQINRRTVFLKLVRIEAGAGKNVAWAAEAGGQTAEDYAEGADAVNFGSDAQGSCILNWGLYRAPFQVTQLAMDAAATTDTPLGDQDLWARNLVNASMALASRINSDCYIGTGTGVNGPTVVGLVPAIGTTNNVYATVDRTVGANAYFIPTVTNPGTPTAVSFANVRLAIENIYTASGETPELGLCSPSLITSLAGLFDATRRIVQPSVMTMRGNVALDAGYQAVEIEGVIFIKDKDAQAGTLFFVNTNHVWLEYLTTKQNSAIAQRFVGPTDGFGAVPLGMNYEALAKTGPSEKAEVTTTIQMKVDRPNSCGVLLNQM